jgi:hypothetical protein
MLSGWTTVRLSEGLSLDGCMGSPRLYADWQIPPSHLADRRSREVPVRIWARTWAILIEVFRGVPQSLRANAEIVPRLGHNCFLPNIFQFTASVVYWSEFLATDPEVLGSITGASRFSEKQRVWNGVHSASWGQLRSYLEETVAAPVKKTETNDRGDPLRWPLNSLYPQKLALLRQEAAVARSA